MHNMAPRFRYENLSAQNNSFGCIKLNDVVVHTIIDLDQFYKKLGYPADFAIEGISPDEFVWDTYFKHNDNSCESCYQLRVIDYLLVNSIQFVEKYGENCDDWISYYAELKKVCTSNKCFGRKL